MLRSRDWGQVLFSSAAPKTCRTTGCWTGVTQSMKKSLCTSSKKPKVKTYRIGSTSCCQVRSPVPSQDMMHTTPPAYALSHRFLHIPHITLSALQLIVMELLLAGRSKTFPENQAMLGFLTTSSKHPIMHLNTLFQDSWESVCKAKASAIDDMTSHEKTAVRVKAAQRLKLQYLLQISPYFESEEEDRSLIPSFCSSEALKSTGSETAPWEAAWHRTIRFLVCIH